MLVIEASAALDMLLGEEDANGPLAQRVRLDGDLHAPHLIDVEFISALRRLVRTGEVSADRAADARHDFSALSLIRYPHQELAERIWQLRDNVTAYDATYVALAEVLEVPLITCDGKLAAARGHRAAIELYPAPSPGSR